MSSSIMARLVGALAVILALPLAAPAQQAPEGMVTGTVIDSASGEPLSNVQLIAAPLNRFTTTNEAGEFTFRGLTIGDHHITALFIGFAPGHADVRIPPTDPTVRLTIRMRASPLRLSAVQVTATPIATDPREVAQSTTELSGQALARTIGSSVAQTLANEPGIAVRFDGPGAAAPIIRGLGGERILVLQDGNRAGDLSSSSSDHSVSIDPLVAQRVEVVRGPASLLYGSNALGGVVNVISNDIPNTVPSHFEGNVALQSESATPGMSGSATLTMPMGSSAAVALRAGVRRLDDMRTGGGGTLANSYFDNQYAVAALGLTGTRGNGGIAYRGYDFEYGLPSADGEGPSIDGRRHELAGRADVTTSLGPIGSVRANATTQWYEHDEVEVGGEIGTTFDLRTQTLDVIGGTRIGRVTGALGISGLLKQYAARGEEALSPPANSSGFGALLYQEVPLRQRTSPDAAVPRLQVGGRFDVYRIETRAGEAKFGSPRTTDFESVSGSIGLSVPVGPAATVAVSLARAFRAPSVEELFSEGFHHATGTYDRGNPDLQAETNQGVDALIRLHGARVNGQLGAYYNRVHDFITPSIVGDTTDEDGEVFPLNEFAQSDATMHGVEARLEAEAFPGVVVGVLGDAVRGVLADDTPIPFIPAARIGALARWESRRYSLSADVRHAFAQDRVPDPVTENDPAAVATEAYTLFNLSAGANVPLGGMVHNITLRADNVLDERYRDATSRIKHFAWNPGRNFSLVYRLLF